MHDVLIIGAGPIGLTAAHALAHAGLDVHLIGQLPRERPNSPDLRTAALFSASVRLLDRLGIWAPLADAAAPLRAIRIIDATGHLLRAPEQMFAASDLDLTELGYNVANPALVKALANQLDHAPGGPIPASLGTTISSIDITTDHVTAQLDTGQSVCARIAVAADGRGSITRQSAGIAARTWTNGQVAVTAHFDHDRPHGGISTEIHTRDGPCTVVPFGERRCSLVWMTSAAHAANLEAATDHEFRSILETRLEGLLGSIRTITPRRSFPLTSLLADVFARDRVALVGEAAHAFPPIGAQGLNLGLRDVAALADQLGAAHRQGDDVGAKGVLAAYDKARRADVRLRTFGVDAFNRSLASRAPGLVRGALMHATNASPTFKRFLMERGIEPVGPRPTLMR